VFSSFRRKVPDLVMHQVYRLMDDLREGKDITVVSKGGRPQKPIKAADYGEINKYLYAVCVFLQICVRVFFCSLSMIEMRCGLCVCVCVAGRRIRAVGSKKWARC
jgi:hypothetical protein